MSQPIPQQHLPLPAKCALEYLDVQGEGSRTIEMLDRYLDHYFKFYGLTVEPPVRYACHRIAINRYALSGPEAHGALEQP